MLQVQRTRTPSFDPFAIVMRKPHRVGLNEGGRAEIVRCDLSMLTGAVVECFVQKIRCDSRSRRA
ncbi:MAG: hypothetical protein C4326_06930 [Ignavibacteria bacterium]